MGGKCIIVGVMFFEVGICVIGVDSIIGVNV